MKSGVLRARPLATPHRTVTPASRERSETRIFAPVDNSRLTRPERSCLGLPRRPNVECLAVDMNDSTLGRERLVRSLTLIPAASVVLSNVVGTGVFIKARVM